MSPVNIEHNFSDLAITQNGPLRKLAHAIYRDFFSVEKWKISSEKF